MLGRKFIVLSVMTSVALSGCSKNESVQDTVNTTHNMSVESKKIETELNRSLA